MKFILRRLLPAVALVLGAGLGSANAGNVRDAIDCSRLGTARIRVADQLFVVPRTILGQIELDTGKTDQSWQCNDRIITARNFFINVTPTYAGAKFYQDWIYDRKLPHTIEIAERGKFKYFNDARFASLLEKSTNTISEEGEFRTVETKGQIFYASKLALRGFQSQAIVFVCSKQSPKGSRTCHTNYHLSNRIDLRYEFRDPPIAVSDWVSLDRRTRQIITDLSFQSDP